MTKTSKRNRNTSILPHLPATYSTTGKLYLRSVKLEIRGNLLLISRRDIEKPDTVVPISAKTTIRASSHRVTISSIRLSLSSSSAAKKLLHALEAARKTKAESYTIIRELGHGASGTVFLAKRQSDRKMVAMKRIPKYEALQSDSATRSFVNEYLALSTLSSPFTLSLLDAFETSHHFNFVTPVANHGDLQSVQARVPRGIPEPAAKQLFAEMLEGLEDLHRAGFLYRDMKLPNMLLTDSGHVQLADFGLVKKMKVESTSSSSSSDSGDDEEFRLVGRTRSFVGTRRYMSPEHAVRSLGYGAPADMWALGVCLYVMVTGRYPFGNEVMSGSNVELFDAIRNEELVFPKRISKEVREVLEGLLERDCLERWEVQDLRASAWLKGMNWRRLREQATSGKRVDCVISLLEKNQEMKDKKGRSKVTEEISRVAEEGYLVGFGGFKIALDGSQ